MYMYIKGHLHYFHSSCQFVHHRAPKLPGTENDFNKSFLKKVVRPL